MSVTIVNRSTDHTIEESNELNKRVGKILYLQEVRMQKEIHTFLSVCRCDLRRHHCLYALCLVDGAELRRRTIQYSLVVALQFRNGHLSCSG